MWREWLSEFLTFGGMLSVEDFIAPVLVSVVAGIAVLLATHVTSVRRERRAARRQYCVERQIDAHSFLQVWLNAGHESVSVKRNELVSALSDVSLMGDREQAELAKEVIQGVDGGVPRNKLQRLVDMIDQSVRRELGLEVKEAELGIARRAN